MWKSVVGHNVSVKVESGGDDWDTDPDFVNDVSEQEQRWGAKTIEGSGRTEHINVHQLRNKVSAEHDSIKKKELAEGPKASYGYGGKFGTERDRMDKSALGHEYVADVGKHSSQLDAAKGFGGKYGVQKDRTDKSALGFEYKGETEKHASQKDYAKGFGGKYGVEKEKVDKAALGYDYKAESEKHASQKDYAKGFGGKYGVEKEKVDKAALGYDYKAETELHESQKDHSRGFGGKFGVQKDRVDKVAHGWDHQEQVKPHESQTDYAKGFGGRYGVQSDRVDKSAAGFQDMESPTSSYQKTKPVEASSSGASSLKSRFENMAKASEEETRKRAEEEKARRQARDKREQEGLHKKKEVAEQESHQVCSKKAPVSPPVAVARKPKEEPARPDFNTMQQDSADNDYEEPPELPERPDFSDDTPALPPRLEDPTSVPKLPPRQEPCPSIPQLPPRNAPSPDIPQLPPRNIPEDEFQEDNDGRDYEELPVTEPEHDPIYDENDDIVGEYEDINEMKAVASKSEENIYESGEGKGESAVALYDYQGEGDDEISFEPDDVITNIEMVDEGWWRGQCNGKSGLFPANYVQLL
ncbi:src substrate cortactin-like [Protopterus annectens]|uniref:src substrate cortactin-like n=1 Tax=Protopterus annectens TaxID=7888 RepID=UPI001CFA043E|nr:src substrate cortactin-like [Protopterus annectens]